MATATFDTHAYIKKLMSVGFTEPQAEVQAETFKVLIESEFASKRDLKETEGILRREMKETEGILKRDIESVRSELKRDIEASRSELKKDIKEFDIKIEFVRRDVKELELNLKKDIESIKADTIKWLTGLFLAQCGIIAAMIKLF